MWAYGSILKHKDPSCCSPTEKTESNLYLATPSGKGLEVNAGFLHFMYETTSKAGSSPGAQEHITQALAALQAYSDALVSFHPFFLAYLKAYGCFRMEMWGYPHAENVPSLTFQGAIFGCSYVPKNSYRGHALN